MLFSRVAYYMYGYANYYSSAQFPTVVIVL